MNKRKTIEFVDFRPEHADELVTMWRASFERAVGVIDPHPIEEQRDYLFQDVVPNNKVRVALENGQIIGFIAASAEVIAQLYIHINHQGCSIGSKFLAWAKGHSNGKLWLYTFESNKKAQRFYESKGFHIIERGFEEHWQLPDIKYEWVRSDEP